MAHDAWQPLIWRKGERPAAEQLPMSARLWRELRLAAQFCTYAARADDLQTLLDETCRIAAEGLGVTFAKLLIYQPDERAFLLQAGVGWPDGIVGQARFDADVSTAAGFAWRSGQSIVCNNLMKDGRFSVPALLIEHEIVRSINVVVPGAEGTPFGVLEVESPEAGEFGAHDAHFLQLLAHSLAAAAIAQSTRQVLHEAHMAQRLTTDVITSRQLPFWIAPMSRNPAGRWRDLARAWTKRAGQFCPGPKRDIYLEIADGYSGLADIGEDSRSSAKAS